MRHGSVTALTTCGIDRPIFSWMVAGFRQLVEETLALSSEILWTAGALQPSKHPAAAPVEQTNSILNAAAACSLHKMLSNEP